jgi:GNAT superfamily N-acetyltransferase
MSIEVIEADLTNDAQVVGIIEIIDAYAREPAGGSEPLTETVREKLRTDLRTVDAVLIMLAMQQNTPVGVAVCFRGYSTFYARPLLNIHDLAVLPTHRGQGIGHALLAAVEERARAENCCKLTLEVLDHNRGARRLYASVGFDDGGPGQADQVTRFLQKRL